MIDMILHARITYLNYHVRLLIIMNNSHCEHNSSGWSQRETPSFHEFYRQAHTAGHTKILNMIRSQFVARLATVQIDSQSILAGIDHPKSFHTGNTDSTGKPKVALNAPNESARLVERPDCVTTRVAYVITAP